jgi:flagellar biosynthesis protein FlhG
MYAVCDRFLDVTLDFLGMVPYDDYLRKAVKAQKPVVNAYPSSKAARAFDKIGKEIDKWPQPAGAKGHLEFFVERLVQYSAASF